MLHDESIGFVEEIHCSSTTSITLSICKFEEKENYFNNPIPSTHVGIYKVQKLMNATV